MLSEQGHERFVRARPDAASGGEVERVSSRPLEPGGRYVAAGQVNSTLSLVAAMPRQSAPRISMPVSLPSWSRCASQAEPCEELEAVEGL
mgnify:CR=1 FL=1